HFAQMKNINQFGHNEYTPYGVYPSSDQSRRAFDIRTKEAYHGGHTKGTINIPFNKNFINQIGWYLNYEEEIDLIGDVADIEKARYTLQLIGYDLVAGYRKPQSQIVTESIHSADLAGDEEKILDVRNNDEWNRGHLPQAVHIPHGKLSITYVQFNYYDKLFVHC